MRLNGTFIEELNPFVNMDLDDYRIDDNPFATLAGEMWDNIATIVNMVVCLLSTISSAIIVYIIARTKPWRGPLHYVMHYAILCLLDLINKPLEEIFFKFYMNDKMSSECLCVSWEFGAAVTSGYIFMAIMTAISWFASTLNGKLSKILTVCERYIIILTYIVCSVRFILTVMSCWSMDVTLSGEFLVLEMCFALIGITIINIIARRKQLDEEQMETKYLLQISTVVIVLWSPVIFFHFIFFMNFDLTVGMVTLIDAVQYLSEVAGFAGPIVIFYVLCRNDQDFKKYATTKLQIKRSILDDEIKEEVY